MMQKYGFSLLSALTAMLLINGCDSSCCQDVTPDQSNQPVQLIKPTPIITLNGESITSPLTCDPTQNETIRLTAASTDSDGRVIENIWTVDGQDVQNGTVECPQPGESKEICLTAVDDDNQENRTCITLNAAPEPEQQLKPPVATIEKGENTVDGQYFDCSNMHDQDTIDSDGISNPYGSDHAIQEVTWVYTYYKADGTIESGPTTTTQTQFNEENGQAVGTCKKWFHTDNGVATIDLNVTALDDDNQTATQTYTYDVETGALTQP